MQRICAALAALAVSFSLAFGAVDLTGFSHKFTLTLPEDFAGELEGFPVLLRLSSETLPSLTADTFQTEDGRDLLFVDADGNAVPHEVQSWNPAGESLVWVRFPLAKAGATLTAYCGNPDWQPELDPTAVWDGFVGVWHMDTIDPDTLATPDASGHALDLIAKSASQTVSASGGALGNALVNATASGGTGGGFLSPVYTGIFNSPSFTLSAWFNHRAHAANGYERFFSSKKNYNEANGYEMEVANGDAQKTSIRGGNSNAFNGYVPDQRTSKWNHIALVYDGTTCTLYTNGVRQASGTIVSVTHDLGLAVGNNAARTERAYYGDIDEVRFHASARPAEWLANDHALQAGTLAPTYTDLQLTDPSAVVFANAPQISFDGTTPTISITIAQNTGTLVLHYGTGKSLDNTLPIAENAGEGTYAISLSDLEPDACYGAQVVATTASGAVTRSTLASFLTAAPVLSVKQNAAELNLSLPLVFTVTRPESATAFDVTLPFTLAGTASPGVNYTPPESDTLTIPAGETSVELALYPLRTRDGDHTVTFSLSNPPSPLPEVNTVEGIIATLTTETGYNTWLGGGNNLASEAANWSGGLPQSTDHILFDGRVTSADCTWDLSCPVASWTQREDYAGTIALATTYPEYDTAFTCLNVSGDFLALGGTLSHLPNDSDRQYRAALSVGGNFELGAAASINLCGKGYAQGKYPSGSSVSAHAAAPSGNPSHLYGAVTAPEELGSGGPSANNAVSHGGGAIKLKVSGSATLNGGIDARSSSQKNGNNPEKGVGAGGSIWVEASSISGSGVLNASAWTADVSETSYAEGGSGGRIALVATAGAVEIPWANLKANGGFGAKTSGGGTVFVKGVDDAYGALLVGMTKGREWNYQVRYPALGATTAVPPGEMWRFDRIWLRDYGILAIPEGATLSLPNGFASVCALNPADNPACGLLYLGGTLSVPETDEHRLDGGWFFCAAEPYVFKGDVRCSGYAGLGNFYLLQPNPSAGILNDVTVEGNLSVEASGRIFGVNRGCRSTVSAGFRSAHGGVSGADQGGASYDSILHPHLPGLGGQGYGTYSGDAGNTTTGSGAIRLTVSGTLMLDGTANVRAVSDKYDHHCPAAGALDITCARLEGSGSISADAVDGNGVKAAGAAGRIAVRLTDPSATFSEAWLGNINARSAKGATSPYDTSAGTIYLQSGAQSEGCGTILVRGKGDAANTMATPIPAQSQTYDVDASSALANATLRLEAAARVQVYSGIAFAALEVPEASASMLDLNGNLVTVKDATLGSVRLAPGTYTPETLPDFLLDSSESLSGALRVTGSATLIIIR
ncbi:MAG: DUF2341 domain-containing protein [Kiritimatiellia bacterium]